MKENLKEFHALSVRPIPKPETTSALTTGAYVPKRASQSEREMRRTPCTMAMPMPINTAAKPRLNETISSMPNGTRFRATATNRMAMASGQGTSPPLTPRATRDFKVTCGAAISDC